MAALLAGSEARREGWPEDKRIFLRSGPLREGHFLTKRKLAHPEYHPRGRPVIETGNLDLRAKTETWCLWDGTPDDVAAQDWQVRDPTPPGHSCQNDSESAAMAVRDRSSQVQAMT
jgi:hypothetical protein